ncbi:MAG: hypothetical protein ACLUD0_05970 [Eubacterium ramulus]
MVFHSNDISTDHDIAWNRAMGTKTESCHHAGIIWKNVWSENRLFVCAVIALQTFVILTIETQGLGTVFNALSAGKVSVAMGAIIGGIIGIFM